ncbi:hypothetical protein E1A91_A04G116500v1 [Gossypium mustelinum]|uniref:Cullin N-terminal domain-containing protein n=1 Tax=Gossypium mustelinum TaxID=34275 RepID=A0A5D2ZQ10_GOSMU|nr:hypothetical protein E1A91_A04G116500v1 [Gossypium mustelinum]
MEITTGEMDEVYKISEERLKQALDAESKIVQLKTVMHSLEEKISDIESENQVLRQQTLLNCIISLLLSKECLRKERERVSNYLYSSSETKLLEKVQHELLVTYANRLLEKEHSGCRALLRDNKVEDLSRMYRLYCKIPRGLEPVANVFKQHVTAEGTALVQQAEDACCQVSPWIGYHQRPRSHYHLKLGIVSSFILNMACIEP